MGEPCIGGRGGIRTHGTLAGTPVFKTGALNHSATLPTLDVSDLAGARGRGKRQIGPDWRAGGESAWRRSRAFSRTRKPASSSTAAPGLPWSKPEIRWRPNRGCACDTCHSRCSSELIKAFGIAGPERGDASSEVRVTSILGTGHFRPGNDNLQTHGPRKSPRSPGP